MIALSISSKFILPLQLFLPCLTIIFLKHANQSMGGNQPQVVIQSYY